jgi:di/tricarboxylate transporter
MSFQRCGRGKVKESNDKDSLKELIKTKFEYLGPASWGEISVGIIFMLLIILWITRDLHAVPGWKYFFKDS